MKAAHPSKVENLFPIYRQFYDEMISVLKTAYNDNVIEQWEHNMLLEMIKDVEERIFHDYPEIKEEVDPMVAQLLNLESLKMRDEAEQQKREAVRQASLSNIEMLKQFGITLTEEQKQAMLKQVFEQQGLEE